MKKIVGIFVVVFLSLNLSACISSYTPPTRYQLTAVSQKKFSAVPVQKTLLVSQTIPTQAYQSDQMLYVNEDYHLSYFIKNSWDVPPTDMLFPLLVKSLQNTGYFAAVLPAPTFAYTDWRIDTTLLQLEQNFTQKPSVVSIEINATLINDKNSRVIASKRFLEKVAAPMDTPYGGVLAANMACQKMMEDISAWAVANVKASKNN